LAFPVNYISTILTTYNCLTKSPCSPNGTLASLTENTIVAIVLANKLLTNLSCIIFTTLTTAVSESSTIQAIFKLSTEDSRVSGPADTVELLIEIATMLASKSPARPGVFIWRLTGTGAMVGPVTK